MTRSVPLRRLPGLVAALLAVFGLAVFGLLAPASSATPGARETRFATFPDTLCHGATDEKRHSDRPLSDCDACLLCLAAHTQHAGTLLLPQGVGLAALAVTMLRLSEIAVPAAAGGVAPRGPRARAPPSAT